MGQQSPRLKCLQKYVPQWCNPESADDVKQELARALIENPRIRNSELKSLAAATAGKFAKHMEVGLTCIGRDGEEYERELPALSVIPKKRARTRRSNGDRRHGRLVEVPRAKLRRLASLFNDGKLSLSEIAVKLGFSPKSGDSFVADEFSRCGILLRRRPKTQVTPGLSAMLVTLYEKGLSIRSVSKLTGLSGTCVRRHLAIQGVTLRPMGAHGATKCRYVTCVRPVFKQTRTYFDTRCSRQVTSTFGNTCRFHFVQERAARKRKWYDAHHVRVKGLENCPKGHEYSESNTYYWNGSRSCRICQRDASARYRQRKRASSLSQHSSQPDHSAAAGKHVL